MNTDVANFLASRPYSDATKATYCRILTDLETLTGLQTISAAEVLKWVERPTWGNSLRYVAACAARGYLAWKYGKDHPALEIRIKRIKPRRQRTLSPKRALELLASFNRCTPKGARDLSIAALALDTGLRCSELCRLQLADVDLIERKLQVIIKGGQWGYAIYSPETAQYLADWLYFRKPAPGVGSVFVNIAQGTTLTRDGLRVIVLHWGQKIDIKLSPHDMRRSFATISTILGAPSRVVQAAGRWSDISMVERYTREIDQSAITPYFPTSHLKLDR